MSQDCLLSTKLQAQGVLQCGVLNFSWCMNYSLIRKAVTSTYWGSDSAPVPGTWVSWSLPSGRLQSKEMYTSAKWKQKQGGWEGEWIGAPAEENLWWVEDQEAGGVKGSHAMNKKIKNLSFVNRGWRSRVPRLKAKWLVLVGSTFTTTQGAIISDTLCYFFLEVLPYSTILCHDCFLRSSPVKMPQIHWLFETHATERVVQLGK